MLITNFLSSHFISYQTVIFVLVIVKGIWMSSLGYCYVRFRIDLRLQCRFFFFSPVALLWRPLVYWPNSITSCYNQRWFKDLWLKDLPTISSRLPKVTALWIVSIVEHNQYVCFWISVPVMSIVELHVKFCPENKSWWKKIHWLMIKCALSKSQSCLLVVCWL